MVPFSMFHCGFSVPRGSGAFRAMVFVASCFLLYITVDDLSPNVISSFDGIILPGVHLGLSSGAFLESLLSVAVLLPDWGSFCAASLYWILSSGLFGFLPKCDSNGAILVILLGMSLILCFMFATIVDMSSDDQIGSIVSIPKFRFIVWISLSTVPIALWSPAGLSISLCYYLCSIH